MFNAVCIIFPLDSAVLEAGLLILAHLVIQQILTECLLCDEPWAMGQEGSSGHSPCTCEASDTHWGTRETTKRHFVTIGI